MTSGERFRVQHDKTERTLLLIDGVSVVTPDATLGAHGCAAIVLSECDVEALRHLLASAVGSFSRRRDLL